jgi:hypothetical protein
MKIRTVGTELLYADGQTDTTNLISAFRNFAKATKRSPVIFFSTFSILYLQSHQYNLSSYVDVHSYRQRVKMEILYFVIFEIVFAVMVFTKLLTKITSGPQMKEVANLQKFSGKCGRNRTINSVYACLWVSTAVSAVRRFAVSSSSLTVFCLRYYQVLSCWMVDKVMIPV